MPLGLVPTELRGALPFALVHGESLVATASWALSAAGVDLYDVTVPWAEIRAADQVLVVHDPLCPLTPPDFIAELAERAQAGGRPLVAVHPVTDTVKQARDDGLLGATVDRDGLVVVASPVAIPAAVVAAMTAPPDPRPEALVESLAEQAGVAWVEAPALARRIVSADELPLLEALSRAAARRGPDRPDRSP